MEPYIPSNILYLTFKEHKLAHFYRYLSFGEKGDLIAYKLMCGQTKEGRQLMSSFAGKIGGRITSKENKTNNIFFLIKSGKKTLDIKVREKETSKMDI